MDRVLVSVHRDGTILAIDSSQLPVREVLPDADIFRASHLLPINDRLSPYHGWYFADMTPLAQATGQAEFNVTLYPPQPTYALARQQEEQWLLQHYLQKPRTPSSACPTACPA